MSIPQSTIDDIKQIQTVILADVTALGQDPDTVLAITAFCNYLTNFDVALADSADWRPEFKLAVSLAVYNAITTTNKEAGVTNRWQLQQSAVNALKLLGADMLQNPTTNYSSLRPDHSFRINAMASANHIGSLWLHIKREINSTIDYVLAQ